jgi:hypothetical protein
VLIGHITAKAAFDDETLFDELQDVLIKNKLLRAEEKKVFRRLRPIIALYTIAIMHQSAILLDDKSLARLYIGSDGDALVVISSAPCPTKEIPTLHIAVAVFTTSLRVEDWCAGEIVEAIKANPSPVSDFGIELGPDAKLRRIKGVQSAMEPSE